MVNYDSLRSLLPLIQELLPHSDTYCMTGLQSVWNLLKVFKPQIVQLKTTPVGKGVDLAREDRIAKCDNCVEAMFLFFKSHQLRVAL
jgi:hypothetical protein